MFRNTVLLHLMLGIATVCLITASGCRGATGSGALEARTHGRNPAVLPVNFDTVVYAGNENTVASFYLINMPVDRLLDGAATRGQIIHIELLWTPMPGMTPLDPSAANLSVRHVILAEEEFGVYGGTGFARVSGDIGDNRVSLSVASASLSLLERSDGFADRLAPGELSGKLTAVHDPALARKIGLAASQIVTNRLGRPRYVMAE